MKKVGIIMAMEAEAAQLIHLLGLNKFCPKAFYEKMPMQFYSGRYKNRLEIVLGIPGKDLRYNVDQIGTESAAALAFALISEFQPDLLMNAGTAGSFSSKGAQIGKVYLSHNCFFFHDHRIPIKGWDQFGLGSYPSLDVGSIALKLNLERANISSGNSLDFTQEELLRILSSGAILKEMEAAAIAMIAYQSKTAFFAVKSVTNLIDLNPDSPSEFEKNFSTAVKCLTEKTLQVIDQL